MNTGEIKVTTTTTVKKEFTIEEGELEAILEEYGRKHLHADADTSVIVRIECRSGGYVQSVTFTAEKERRL